MGQYDVILQAGGTGKCELAEGVGYKSLIVLDGRPMVRIVAQTLRACRQVGRIIAVGPKAELEEALHGVENVRVIEGVPDMYDNMLIGAEGMAEDTRVMMVAVDVPMVTPEMVDWLCTAFDSMAEADFIYPIIEKKANERKYPDVKRTYVKLHEGSFTGGNITCVRISTLKKTEPLVRKLIANRKRPDKTAAILGFRFIIGMLTGSMRIAKLEKHLSRLAETRLRALVCPYPEVGNDVDKPSDLEMARKYFQDKVQN